MSTKTAVTLAGCVLGLSLSGCALSPVEGAAPPTGASTPAVASTSRPSASAPRITGPAGPATVPIGAKGSPRGKIPAAKKVDDRNASAVAQAYVVTAWSVDTRIDHSPNDAARRATRWMTPRLAKVYAAPLPGDGGADWAALARAHGYSSVKAVEVFSQTGGTTFRQVRHEALTVKAHNGSGARHGSPESFMVTVTVVRGSVKEPWRVSIVDASS